MPILNDVELNEAILKDLKDIIEEVSDQLYEKLLWSINDVVYNVPGESPNWYDRNTDHGGLMSSFDRSKANRNLQHVKSRIVYDPLGNELKDHDDRWEEMIEQDENETDLQNPSAWTHGSNFYEVRDIRKFLAQIIIEGKSGPIFGDGYWTLPRDFWTPIVDMTKNGDLDKMIETSFTKRQIKWKKV